MKVNATQTVTNFFGDVLQDGDRQLTVGDLCSTVLLAPPVNEGDKMACYRLAHRFSGAEEVDLSLEEATLIKRQAERHLSTLAFGRIADVLEA